MLEEIIIKMAKSKTPNLNLILPAFSQSPWHDDVNNNFRAIDAIINSLLGISFLKGVYTNTSQVNTNERYFDPSNGFYYQAQSSFITLNSPTTFAEERAAYPARWELLDASIAIDAATTAAIAASTAIEAANAIQNVANTIDTVSYSGAGIVNPITMPFTPIRDELVLVFINGELVDKALYTIDIDELTYTGGWPVATTLINLVIISSLPFITNDGYAIDDIDPSFLSQYVAIRDA